MNGNERNASNAVAIIPPRLAVKAMRDSGYRNTAYALAELIDNSIQASASEVELICVEHQEQVNGQFRTRLKEIGTLDNGTGMTAEILSMALQFGNGTHLEDRAGIGRFGMGLPNSSISQCLHLDVWTWMNGPENAMYSYLDVDKIMNGEMERVPDAEHSPVPAQWRERSQIIGTTGTLVVWSGFKENRLSWRGAKATLRNTEEIIGRMYRKFINNGDAAIHLVQCSTDHDQFRRFALVNDPLYLMPNSSTPFPFNEIPMFEKWGEKDEEFDIEYNGKTHKVIVRCSLAKPETVSQDGLDRGRKPYGKHAGKNIGLSIVREGRELELDASWAKSYDPRERWWGAEIEFPSNLDELFGVTNNKQHATIFSGLAQFDWESEADEGESQSDFFKRAKEEGDPRTLLLPIVTHIRNQLSLLGKAIENQQKGSRSTGGRIRHDQIGVEDTASTKFRERANEGHEAPGDDQEFSDKDRKILEKNLVEDKSYTKDAAKEIADAVLHRKLKVIFIDKNMDGYSFFNVESVQGGVTNVIFNSSHPFYEKLVNTLNPDPNDCTEKELLDRVHMASDTLRIIFSAWARYELEEIKHKQKLFDMRQEWGKMARFFLDGDED